MNANLSWAQFGDYKPQHGASDLGANAAMSVAGGGHSTLTPRPIPANPMTPERAKFAAMRLGATSVN